MDDNANTALNKYNHRRHWFNVKDIYMVDVLL